ncbi:MAG: peptide-methionine (S)-S-oxide reductase MsrA [Dehalococcoidia bacterium]
MTGNTALETATLAGGCFWCIEAIFREIQGVASVVPGYTGGNTVNPSYEEVCTGTTGHAEAVRVTFDPTKISYRTVLEVFFSVHDPTSLNRQGPDTGTQYRSAIFYNSEEQKALAEQVIGELSTARLWQKPIVTQIAPARQFYTAEDYHVEYFSRHPQQPYCQMVISPKVDKLRKKWANLAKREVL